VEHAPEVDRESDRTDAREGWTDQEMERDGDSQDSAPQSEPENMPAPEEILRELDLDL